MKNQISFANLGGVKNLDLEGVMLSLVTARLDHCPLSTFSSDF